MQARLAGMKEAASRAANKTMSLAKTTLKATERLALGPDEEGEAAGEEMRGQGEEATTSSDPVGTSPPSPPRMPWSPRNDAEVHLERKLRSQILKLLEPDKADAWAVVEDEQEGAEEEDEERAPENVEAMLEYCEALRVLRFRLVPKKVPENTFWLRFANAVERVRDEVLRGEQEDTTDTQQATGSDDDGEGEGGDGEANDSSPSLDFTSEQLRNVASALEMAKGFRTMGELSDVGRPEQPGASSSGRLRRAMEAGRNILARRASGVHHERVVSAVWDLFKSDATVCNFPRLQSTRRLYSAIGAAQVGTFTCVLARHLSALETMKDMAMVWSEVCEEIAWHWKHLQPIPRIPEEENPDVMACKLHQNLQLLNCCIARKRRAMARRRRAAHHREEDARSVTLATGEVVRRQGELEPTGLMMLRLPQEAIYAPETQEAAVLTREQMMEVEQLIMKASANPGIQQLLSDMEAFKAANPGCALEDFVRYVGACVRACVRFPSILPFFLSLTRAPCRYYSPADWKEAEGSGKGEGEGQEGWGLSRRFVEEDNIWLELWHRAKAVPIVDQAPIFDADTHGDSVVEGVAGIAPSDLFEQLLHCAVVLRHASLEQRAHRLVDEHGLGDVMVGVAEVEAFMMRTCGRGISHAKIESIKASFDQVDAFFDREWMKTRPQESTEYMDDVMSEWMIV